MLSCCTFIQDFHTDWWKLSHDKQRLSSSRGAAKEYGRWFPEFATEIWLRVMIVSWKWVLDSKKLCICEGTSTLSQIAGLRCIKNARMEFLKCQSCRTSKICWDWRYHVDTKQVSRKGYVLRQMSTRWTVCCIMLTPPAERLWSLRR